MRQTVTLVALTLIFFMCGAQAGRQTNMQLTSIAFKQGGSIPTKYTCQGEDSSPPLSIAGVPPGARSLALIVDDPDAPDPSAPKTTWVHWVLFNLPTDTAALPEAADSAALPEEAVQGINDWKKAKYGGPCPPTGRHRYFFKLYALDSTLTLGSHTSKAQLEQAMQGHIVEQTELVGTYKKSL